ncbi:pseudouridine synthase [Psychrobium sp. MM17-31]|uniref:pseudouridine synthase n=1 Tax=Psychrobium sp. MM17-31 TaxID=2917758 RepID=UPI001EF5EFF1|nr:pseudouridine synthase [Psychrobium sp. MM17-31]MCG7531706.1 pseudouridine synthase [Psychrobium sp. MM17-31]
MRLAQYIAKCGACSRRNASRLIDEGRVVVDGMKAGHLSFIRGGEMVLVDGELIKEVDKVYYLYNKPVGIDCNLDVNDPASLIHHLPPQEQRLFPVGRLDKDSCGLLLLTNDGELANKLLSPAFKKSKRYMVTVEVSHANKEMGRLVLGHDFIDGMNQPLNIKGKWTTPCEIKLLDTLLFEITLTQGLNRQIRRMCANQGFKVVHLQRTHFAGLDLGDLAQGEYRQLDGAHFLT